MNYAHKILESPGNYESGKCCGIKLKVKMILKNWYERKNTRFELLFLMPKVRKSQG